MRKLHASVVRGRTQSGGTKAWAAVDACRRSCLTVNHEFLTLSEVEAPTSVVRGFPTSIL